MPRSWPCGGMSRSEIVSSANTSLNQRLYQRKNSKALLWLFMFSVLFLECYSWGVMLLVLLLVMPGVLLLGCYTNCVTPLCYSSVLLLECYSWAVTLLVLLLVMTGVNYSWGVILIVLLLCVTPGVSLLGVTPGILL